MKDAGIEIGGRVLVEAVGRTGAVRTVCVGKVVRNLSLRCGTSHCVRSACGPLVAVDNRLGSL